jgi:hypothetical protein
MTNRLYKDSGQALVIIAIAAIGLFGIVGLAVDGSAKFSDRRHAQNAADTAALAAALTKANGLAAVPPQVDSVCSTVSGYTNSTFCLDIIDAAWDRAEENGYDGLIPDSVDVYSPPISGPYINNASYVQVIITSYTNTYFARVLGIRQTKNTVEAVAYLDEGGDLADGAMIISYDDNPSCPSGPGNGGGSVDVSGSSTLNLHNGGIFINSPIACGYNAPNCPQINITGGAGINSVAAIDNIDQKDGFCTFPPPYVKPPENLNQDPIIVPDDIYWPDVPPECSMTGYPTPQKLGEYIDPGPPSRTVEEWLIYPGYYTEFPQALLVANKSDIYMKSGVYCIDPGGTSHDWDLSWSGTDAAKLIGSTESNPSKSNYNKYHAHNPDGVTLYIKSGGGFTLNNNNPTFLDASTSGDLQGYLIVLEGTHTEHPTCTIVGGADININGLIFAPYCNITINGQSSPTAEINAQLIGWDISITGNAVINFNYDPSNQVKLKRRVGLMR